MALGDYANIIPRKLNPPEAVYLSYLCSMWLRCRHFYLFLHVAFIAIPWVDSTTIRKSRGSGCGELALVSALMNKVRVQNVIHPLIISVLGHTGFSSTSASFIVFHTIHLWRAHKLVAEYIRSTKLGLLFHVLKYIKNDFIIFS